MDGEAQEAGGRIDARPRPPSRRWIDADSFAEAFGESLASALDLSTWVPGDDVSAHLLDLRRQIGQAAHLEDRQVGLIREHVFPRLRTRPDAVPGAGLYGATAEQLAHVHRNLLLNGGVDACDGTVATHDALPLTVTRIGVCLVSYQGKQNRYAQQLFRRDFGQRDDDTVANTLAMLDRRRERAGLDPNEQHDALSELTRRGIMT